MNPDCHRLDKSSNVQDMIAFKGDPPPRQDMRYALGHSEQKFGMYFHAPHSHSLMT